MEDNKTGRSPSPLEGELVDNEQQPQPESVGNSTFGNRFASASDQEYTATTPGNDNKEGGNGPSFNAYSISDIEREALGDDAQYTAGPMNIPDYRDPDIDPELKDKLDKLISLFDIEDFDTASTFGIHVNDSLSKLADEINEQMDRGSRAFQEIESFEEEFSNLDFAGTANKLKKSALNIGMSTWDWARKHPKTAIGTAVALPFTLAGAALIPAGSKAHEKFRQYKNPRRASAQREANALRKLVLKSGELIQTMEESQKQLPGIKEAVSELAKERLIVFNKTTLYIGAGREMLARLDEDILPAQKQIFEDDKNETNHEILENRIEYRDLLEQRLGDMEAERAVNISLADTLRKTRKLLRSAERRINNHLRVTSVQWKLLGSQAGLMLLHDKMAQADYEATQQAAEMLEGVTNMQKQIEEVSKEAATTGSYDLKRVQKHLEKRQQSLLTNFSNASDTRKQIARDRDALDKAGLAFMDTLHKTSERALLGGPDAESAELLEQQQEAGTPDGGAENTDGSGQPEKPAKSAGTQGTRHTGPK